MPRHPTSGFTALANSDSEEEAQTHEEVRPALEIQPPLDGEESTDRSDDDEPLETAFAQSCVGNATRCSLRGQELDIFRQQRGVRLGLLSGEGRNQGTLQPSTPVLAFEELLTLGASTELVTACKRCAGASPLATAIQSECWGLLLERQGVGRKPELPTSESLGGAVAVNAAANLLKAAGVALPESDEEMLLDTCASSNCRVREDRDLVGIAPTGSGKTMAYLVPLLADGLCQHRCSPACQPDYIFGQFKKLFLRSFPIDQGSNGALLQRLEKLQTGKFEAVSQAMQQVVKKAVLGKDQAVVSSWKEFEDNLSSVGLLRPSALVLAPTRELAQQVGHVAQVLGAASSIVIGGVDHERQRDRLRIERPSLLIATPGRLRALCGQRPASATSRLQAAGGAPTSRSVEEALPNALVSLKYVARLILDEGDRLLDEGFEDDILALAALSMRRRLVMLFSATWNSTTEIFAVILRSTAVQVSVTGIPSVIDQEVELIPKPSRARRLRDLLREFGSGAKVLVFVLLRREAKALAKGLTEDGIPAFALAGNMSQSARTFMMQAFRDAKAGPAALQAASPTVLVATDVAARGLDVPDVTHVVNFSVGLSIDGYIHRIGRCGRAGRRGTAVTFVTDGDERFAGPLLKLLREAKQNIPPGLAEMAKCFQQSGGISAISGDRRRESGRCK